MMQAAVVPVSMNLIILFEYTHPVLVIINLKVIASILAQALESFQPARLTADMHFMGCDAEERACRRSANGLLNFIDNRDFIWNS